MRGLVAWCAVILLVAACHAYAQQRAGEPASLPELDGKSAKGLEIECRLVKARFAVGEPVNVWCTITNATDSAKPIGWHPSAGGYFCQVQGDKVTWEGLLPMAIPQLDRPIIIKSNEVRPGYVLFIPAHESIRVLLTHKEDRPVKFKGRIIYDPLDPRGSWAVTNKHGPPWTTEWVFSNEFEYEVVAAKAKTPVSAKNKE
jgi:hypothetical protein